MGEVSDGYHTFNELYYYRMLYNAAFFNLLPKEWVHKSKRHHTGEECFGGGWFIVMANLPTGQISNHYELKDWDLFQIPEKEFADEWDGHTPQEAAERLHKYLQQEQPIKVYRVENEKEQKGLWRKFDGTWEPLFDMLTDGQCKDMPMDDNPIYREGGKQWFASAPSKETLQKWFSKRDLEELIANGFTISEFEVVGHKKVSDFEYIFTRDNIISRTYLSVSDIYPQEQPEVFDTVAFQKGVQEGRRLEREEMPKWRNYGSNIIKNPFITDLGSLVVGEKCIRIYELYNLPGFKND